MTLYTIVQFGNLLQWSFLAEESGASNHFFLYFESELRVRLDNENNGIGNGNLPINEITKHHHDQNIELKCAIQCHSVTNKAFIHSYL